MSYVMSWKVSHGTESRNCKSGQKRSKILLADEKVQQNKQISKRTEPKKGSKMDLKNGTKNRGQRSTPDPPQIDHKAVQNLLLTSHTSPHISYTSANVPNASAASPCSPLTSPSISCACSISSLLLQFTLPRRIFPPRGCTGKAECFMTQWEVFQ
jgi:hypothetical protein